jgi:hypothetical protein
MPPAKGKIDNLLRMSLRFISFKILWVFFESGSFIATSWLADIFCI